MALTVAQYKELIPKQLGDTKDNLILSNIDVLWDVAESANTGAPLPVLFLLTKIEAIEMLLGRYKEQVTFGSSGDLNVSLTDRITYLERLKADLCKQAKSRRPGAIVGPILQTAPVMPKDIIERELPPIIDANDPAYGGDPYRALRLKRFRGE